MNGQNSGFAPQGQQADISVSDQIHGLVWAAIFAGVFQYLSLRLLAARFMIQFALALSQLRPQPGFSSCTIFLLGRCHPVRIGPEGRDIS